MSKRLSLGQGLSSVLFWSIISAAFIGPGTVTTTSRAGALYGSKLLWALTFSTLATILLQETAARISIASGSNFGGILARQNRGKQGAMISWMVFVALAFGCAAYEAGNLLGALSGLGLFLDTPRQILTGILGLAGAVLLWSGNFLLIARLMGGLVAIMGVAFLYAAFYTPLSTGEILRGALVPSFPSGSALLTIGLIGTTIVPYNLFLGSGIGQGQEIREMRLGIALAVGIGGLISVAILLGGTQVEGEYSFASLSLALENRLGSLGKALFGLGLFAAGFSSAITAPLAAAVTGSSLFEASAPGQWTSRSWRFRLVWGTVLFVGLIFGILDFRPIPVIILAQALNGLLLPVIAAFLLLAANDRSLLGQYANGWLANILTLAIVGIITLLGLHNIRVALDTVFHLFEEGSSTPYYVIGSISTGAIAWLAWRIFGKN
jgi:manganese transport protein